MWFDEVERKWKRHPMCECQRDPCICAWLPPLDKHGKPIPFPIFDDIRASIAARAKRDTERGAMSHEAE